MKKGNKMMRIASILFIAVLLSTCAISGTFAKFTSSSKGTVTATVAKWDVKVNGSATETFTVALGDIVDTIDSNADAHVAPGKIAPGTKGSFAIVVNTNSEVASVVSVAFENKTFPFDFDYEIVGLVDGVIPFGEKTVTINFTWVWDFEGGTAADDEADLDLAGDALSVDIKITVTQVD